ncbi:hypothetical protein M9458_053769 [Cirrhinus mrigala]|uniref:Uncharacterized protein n=1 Tax=Cirrhinus mrigala TaxID=683832 RepID=A0ABD0MMK8_CIRMR
MVLKTLILVSISISEDRQMFFSRRKAVLASLTRILTSASAPSCLSIILARSSLHKNFRTRVAKAKAHEKYVEANKHSTEEDKRNYTEMLATEAEAAAHRGNKRDLYSNIKKP